MLSGHYKLSERIDAFAEGMYTHVYQAYRIGDRIGTSAAYARPVSSEPL